TLMRSLGCSGQPASLRILSPGMTPGDSLTVDWLKTCSSDFTRFSMSCSVRLKRLLRLRLPEQPAGRGHLLEKRRRLPPVAVTLVPFLDLPEDFLRPDIVVRPEHEPAAVAREAEAVQPHDIDVARTVGLALLQDLARLIDRSEQKPAQDFFVREGAL